MILSRAQRNGRWWGGGRFIQEVGTFWCLHCNTEAHTQTPHTTDLCCIWKQLHSCLTWPAWTKLNSCQLFLCVCCRGQWWPPTRWLRGEWCVISPREHISTCLKWNITNAHQLNHFKTHTERKKEIDLMRHQLTYQEICEDMMSVWIIEHLRPARRGFHVPTEKADCGWCNVSFLHFRRLSGQHMQY